MLAKGDIVLFKNYKDKPCKSYRRFQYVVTQINKSNGKVWIRPLEKRCCFYWSKNPNDLIKIA